MTLTLTIYSPRLIGSNNYALSDHGTNYEGGYLFSRMCDSLLTWHLVSSDHSVPDGGRNVDVSRNWLQ